MIHSTHAAPKRDLTAEEWQAIASEMKNAMANLRSIHGRLLMTTRKADADSVRRAIRHAQHAWHRAEDLAAEQVGDEFSMRIFHGDGWVFWW